MKKLSKYQRKNMTQEEIKEHEKSMLENEPEVISVWGGEIIISKEDGCLLIECFDHEGDREDDAYVENREGAEEYIERYTELLADYEPEE